MARVQKKKIKRTPEKATQVRKAYNHKYNAEFIEALAEEMIKWFEIDKNIWLRDFGIIKRIPRQRFSEFSKKNKYFNYVYEICKDIQESKLVKIGMSKRANATMAIFALKNVSGWRDRQEIENTNRNFDYGKMTEKEIKKELGKFK